MGKGPDNTGRVAGHRPEGLGWRATQLYVRLVGGSPATPFLAFLDLLARHSQRGPRDFTDTL